jgi:voltage-gated potassium channel
MTEPQAGAFKSDKHTRRVLVRGLIRAGVATIGVLLAYFLLPLDTISEVSLWVLLPVALVGFAFVIAVEVRGILQADYPAIRAIEALARDVPLFLALFAAIYYTMGHAHPSWFNEPLSRLDALYFSMTIFATVGFGDIAGVSPEARGVITVQMAADLIVIGFGLRIITSAVQQRRMRAGRPGPFADPPAD